MCVVSNRIPGIEPKAQKIMRKLVITIAIPQKGKAGNLENKFIDTTGFVGLSQAETEEGAEVCERLGVEVIPSLQFWRDGVKLWEHRGVLQIEQDLGEGTYSSSVILEW
jgi:hypothetical protein